MFGLPLIVEDGYGVPNLKGLCEDYPVGLYVPVEWMAYFMRGLVYMFHHTVLWWYPGVVK